jgi:hypothetical protein
MNIIASKKFKDHMIAHEQDFLIPWEGLIKECKEKGYFDKLKKPFEVLEIKLGRNIGYCNLVEVDKNDDVIYAKRYGREIYTKFVKKKEPKLTDSLVIMLNRSYKSNDEYYLVTVFPGNKSCKEPEDMNIVTKDELFEALEFWRNRALIYNETIIQIDSVKTYCPYKNLYLAVA